MKESYERERAMQGRERMTDRKPGIEIHEIRTVCLITMTLKMR